MTDPLPPNLEALEQELAARHGLTPSPELRERVLAAVGRELRTSRRPGRRWWAGAAAVALLWANLSMSVANDAVWQTAPEFDPDAAAAVAAEVQALQPDLSEREAYHLVTLTWPVRWPAAGPAWHPDRPAGNEEPLAWDTR